MALIIALNIIFAALVVGSMVALHARAILVSREEPATPPRRARVRTQPARRLATVNG
jgi:hypothetical protein